MVVFCYIWKYIQTNSTKAFGEKTDSGSVGSFLKNDHLKGADMRGIKNRAWAVVAAVCMMACVFMPGFSQASQTKASHETAIPMDRLGAKIDQRYGAQGSGPAATAAGYRLVAKMQALEAEVTPAGLTVTSLAKKEGLGSFSIVPVALNGKTLATATKETLRTEADGSVMLERGQVQERFTASSDGIRQDFIISAVPVASVSELVLGLTVQNASVSASAKSPNSVMLTLDSGRRLAYSRLHVTDATGKELAARMEPPKGGGKEFRIVVAARDARYPVTIDPTITDEHWESMNTGIPGMDSRVFVLAVDSSGNLYAGGEFAVAGDVSANSIAKWDGESWSALGSGMNSSVNALAFDSSGNLYAGGYFTTAGGVSANRIAKWNGSTWSTLGSGMNSFVNALAFGASDTLYAGGDFTTAGGVSANRIAKWNGSAWSTLGSGMDYRVNALAFDASGTLYAGGEFSRAGEVYSNRIAKWNGSAWSTLGSGMDYQVKALAVDASGTLYAGGWFFFAGGVSVKYIAKWDGASWSALGSGMNKYVNDLAVGSTGTLYAGGDFTTAGGVSANRIAKWDGESWLALGPGIEYTYDESVYALAVDSTGTLYAGGEFTTAGGVSANRIAKWDGDSWLALGSGMNNYVYTLAVDSTGSLYAGGDFTTTGGVSANYIAKWDGLSWSALGSGVNSEVHVFAVDSTGTLYAGGEFTTAGGVSANRIAKWDGESWSALGSGVSGEVNALAFDSLGNLYAGGYFTTAGDVSANSIAKWDGESWSALGSGLTYWWQDQEYPGMAYALAVDSTGVLYAGGQFMTAGGVTANYIAKWDGTAWSALGSEVNGAVHALAVDSIGTLYAGGGFTTAGVVSANRIAKWDGSTWSGLGSGMGMDESVYALAVDASGILYVGGSFTTAGGESANRIAKWDGESWSALGSGMNDSVLALAVGSTGTLYAGGEFATAGGKMSPYIARCNIPECDNDSECREGYQCVDRVCEPIPDDPPALGDGPFLAAGTWPVLPTMQESPMYLDQNYSVLWTFSDDFASCSGACTHVAEYLEVGGSSWSVLDVTANAAKGFAYVTLPVEETLQECNDLCLPVFSDRLRFSDHAVA